jgi:excisionase family DNA binding protein
MIETLTERELAGILQVSTRTIQRLVKKGQIGFLKVGNLTRFTPEHVRQYLLDTERARVKNAFKALGFMEIGASEEEAEDFADRVQDIADKAAADKAAADKGDKTFGFDG